MFNRDNILTGTANINAKIDRIADSQAKADADIHNTALACAVHYMDHGDVTLVERLINAIGKATNRKALVAWNKAHFPLTISFDKESGQHKVKARKGRSAEDFKLDAAVEVPFWDFKATRKAAERTPVTVIKSALTAMGKMDGDVAAYVKALELMLAHAEAAAATNAGADVTALIPMENGVRDVADRKAA